MTAALTTTTPVATARATFLTSATLRAGMLTLIAARLHRGLSRHGRAGRQARNPP